MEQNKRASISGEQGNKGQILRGTGNKDNIEDQRTQENKFSIFGEQVMITENIVTTSEITYWTQCISGEQGNSYPLGSSVVPLVPLAVEIVTSGSSAAHAMPILAWVHV